jgi:hypothetical protein
MPIMGSVNEERDRFLAAAHHFQQRPFALFGFARDVAGLFGRQILI